MIVVALKVLTLFAALTLATAPRTSLRGRMWHDGLVIPLARKLERKLERITRGHVLLTLGLATFFGLVIWVAGGDGLRVSSMALPEVTTWAMTFEISTLIDAIAAVAIVATTARVRTFGAYLAGLAKTPLRRARRRSVRTRRGKIRRRRRVLPSYANDDDPHPRLLAA